MNIFKTITAGDSASWSDLAWYDSATDMHLTSANWALTYQFRGPAQLTLAAVPNGDGWTTNLTTAESATLSAGPYIWSAYLSTATDRATIGGGTIIVKADLSMMSAIVEARSIARKALDDCETALASFNSSGGKVKRYSIGSRQTEFHTLAELMTLRDFWQRRVNNEAAVDAIKNGRANPRSLRVRFV